MFAKLFNRSPESAPDTAQQPRERHRPTLPPVEANPATIAALADLAALVQPPEGHADNLVVESLIADHFSPGKGESDPRLRQAVAIIGQYEGIGVDPTAKITFLQAQAGPKSGGIIDVQPIVDTIEAVRGPIPNTETAYAAISALYNARAADLPIEPGVEADVWRGYPPSLEVTVDGRRTAPLAPNRSIPIGSVAQRVDWNRVAVRAGLVRDRWATAVISERVLGKPRLKFEELTQTQISTGGQDQLVDFVVKDIELNGGDVGDVALRIKKAEQDARHEEIVRREAPRRALRSAMTFVSSLIKR